MKEDVNDISSSSAFVDAATYSAEWTDVKQLQRRSHNVIYTASRYGRRFLLKGLTTEAAQLSDYRLAQEKEFRLGVSVSHPHIAATYSLEDIEGAGYCIVQEYIDGIPLTEWLKTKPSAQARERVLDQLLDALDYLHQRQLVHHDLKSGNILITRNSANVKLIDFGLSDTDDSLSPVHNDPQADIMAVGGLLLLLFAHRYVSIAHRCQKGRYCGIIAVRKAVTRFRLLCRTLPLMLLVLILSVACLRLGLQVYRQSQENRRREQMRERVIQYIELEKQNMNLFVAQYGTFDGLPAIQAFGDCAAHAWMVRDSLAGLYAPDDPLHDETIVLWNARFQPIYNRCIQELAEK